MGCKLHADLMVPAGQQFYLHKGNLFLPVFIQRPVDKFCPPAVRRVFIHNNEKLFLPSSTDNPHSYPQYPQVFHRLPHCIFSSHPAILNLLAKRLPPSDS